MRQPDQAWWRTCVVVASGPSLEQRDLERARGRAATIVVNDGFRLAPWADALYACDEDWWMMHGADAALFAGERWTQDERAASKHGLSLVKARFGEGLCPVPDMIHLGPHAGANSGFQAVGLAVLFGARRIRLLGFDMAPTGRLRHWFGDHPEVLHKASQYGEFVKAFTALAHDLERAGVEVINCSRRTALTCFAREPIEACL